MYSLNNNSMGNEEINRREHGIKSCLHQAIEHHTKGDIYQKAQSLREAFNYALVGSTEQEIYVGLEEKDFKRSNIFSHFSDRYLNEAMGSIS